MAAERSVGARISGKGLRTLLPNLVRWLRIRQLCKSLRDAKDIFFKQLQKHYGGSEFPLRRNSALQSTAKTPIGIALDVRTLWGA